MQLSLNWLKDYVKISKKITPEELGRELSLRTVEVENIERQADKYKNIVVGKILKTEKHPNADRLQIAKVDIGEEILDIVCAAPNIARGQKVPVALVGAILPNGLEIKEAEVRGVKSAGMLCASDELGLGDDHSGILILDKKAKTGRNLAEYLELDDIVLTVDNKSLSNRPDLWCHLGMAREIAVIFRSRILTNAERILTNRIDASRTEGGIDLKVKVEDEELCPRYMAVAMSGVKIGESPAWMRKRLVAAGMRPINNIVDVTNYVMLELGQPLHAFDVSRINPEFGRIKNESNEARIIVRRAKKGEIIETLDEEKRALAEDMLLIANKEKPLAVAGVMGGAESEINSETSCIIIESANFHPVSTRKTSMKLGLRTESSMRYEKSLDPNLCEIALARAVELIKELCPESKIDSDLVDVKNFSLNQGPIEVDLGWLAKKIGVKLATKGIIKILSALGFVADHVGHKLSVKIPSWRATKDISISEDIVEEVVRIYGYDKLAAAMPKAEISPPEINRERILERKVKNILSGAPALAEVYNYSFVGEEQLNKLNINFDSYLRLANPIAANFTMLRQSLAPNLIGNIKINQAKFDSFGIFEIGSVFFSSPGNIRKSDKEGEFLPHQEKRLGICLAGDAATELFIRAKGIMEYLFSSLNLPVAFAEKEIKPAWADGGMCAAVISGREVGYVARLERQAGKRSGLKKKAVVAELNFKDLFDLAEQAAKIAYEPLPKYPPAMRDLAFVVDAKILYNGIRSKIAGFSPLIKEIDLFDVYEGEKIGKGKRSLAFHIIYRSDDRTLTSEEVDESQKGLIKNLEEKFGAKVRDF